MATTTTAAAFGGLSVPAHEDTMEMSSPAPQQPFDNNDDFDIDFDDYAGAANPADGENGGGVHLSDDEHMLEDGNALQADEMMDDDGEQHQALEETIQDDNDVTVTSPVEHEQDEELLDYGEEEDHGDDVQLHVETESTEHVTVDDKVETTGEQPIREVGQEDDQLPPQSEVGDDEPSTKEKAFIKHIAGYVFPDDPDYPGYLKTDLTTVPASPDQPNYEVGKKDVLVDTTAVDVLSNAPATPTDTGLHPMKVRYGDMHMPLFKSRHQPDGLLKDDNLASLSLAELISSARQRLALKIGEDLSEDQELVLGFDRLGLMLVENSRPAFESSLNDILEVFLQLHYNDHVQEIPPLSLTFSLQLKFTSSLATLKQAVASGQGISSFSFLASQAEEDAYQGDDYGDEDAGGDEYEGSEYQDEGDDQHDLFGEVPYGDDTGDAEQYDAAYEQEQHFEEYDAENGEEQNEDYEETAASHEAPQEEDATAAGVHEPQDDSTEPAYHEQDLTVTALPGHSKGDNGVSGAEDLTSNGEKTGSNPVDNSGIGQSDISTILSDEHADPKVLPTDSVTAVTTGATHAELPGEAAAHHHEASGEPHDDFEESRFVTDIFADETSYQDYDAEQPDEEFNATDTHGEQLYEEHIPADHPGRTKVLLHTADDALDEPTDDHQSAGDTYEQHDGTADTAPTSHPEVDDLVDFGDDLEYEDEANDQAVEPGNGLPQAKSGSPLGKRSFEEHIESDLFDDDEPDLKKVKPS